MGGAHQTVMPAVIGPAAFEDFARIAGTGFCLIDESTSSRSLTRELGWNAACYRLACRIKPARARALPSRFLEDPSRMRWSGA